MEDAMLADLVRKSRSYRRFYQDEAVSEATLRELVDMARLTPSGRNIQPLRYLLFCTPEMNAQIFPTLGWAGYLTDWQGPEPGEQPAAYIIVLGDKQITNNFGVDPGIVAQTMLLGATEKGLGGCIIATVQRVRLAELLQIPERYEIVLVLALGKPREEVVIDPVGENGDIKYWRDEAHVHHVPKRVLEDLILKF
jgi:nitroreductase